MTPTDVLALPMRPNDAEAATVRDYLIALLSTLWQEQEGFSGKRPFGNSSWCYDLYAALGDAGLIEVTRDDDGYFVEVDGAAGDSLIAAAILALGAP